MTKLFNVIYGFIAILTTQVSGQETTTTSCTRDFANPAPSGTRCSSRGSLAAANVLRDFIIGSSSTPYRVCGDACFQLGSQCNSFAYHDDNTYRCRLFRTTLAEQGFRTSPVSSGVLFFGKACLVETCVTTLTRRLTFDLDNEHDDDYYNINLPFPVSIFGQSTRTIYMSTNGILGWTIPQSSWNNVALPKYGGSGASYLPPTAVAAFWDDNRVQNYQNQTYCNRGQRLEWYIRGVNPTRAVGFTWRVVYDGGNGYVNLDAEMYENRPGVVFLRFNEITPDRGNGATVGIQSQAANRYDQLYYNQANIDPGDRFEYRPENNAWLRVVG